MFQEGEPELRAGPVAGRFPENLADTDVTAVEVTGPHRVRVRHRDGTSAVHLFRPGDFGTSDFAALDDPAVFATAQMVEPANLGWILPNGLVYDICSDGLWAHAHGVCPDGLHDLHAEVEDARVELAAPRMVELLPRMRALLDTGWRLSDLVKPMWEGNGDLVYATFVRDNLAGDEQRVKEQGGRAPGA